MFFPSQYMSKPCYCLTDLSIKTIILISRKSFGLALSLTNILVFILLYEKNVTLNH